MDLSETGATRLKGRPYTIDEMIDIRSSNKPILDVRKITPDGITASCITIPKSSRSDLLSFLSATRTITGCNDDMSRYYAPRRDDDTDDEDDHIVFQPRHASRHRSTAWQFRRRTSTDRSSQPLSAPSGEEYQKSENFKKFYRAVVSPTHVRVTAGGRIVPNTRPPQPMFTWNPARHYFEPSEGSMSRNKHSPSLSYGAPTQDQMPETQTGALAFLTGGGRNKSDSTSNSNNVNSAATKDIKLSPPDQFDLTKPFMYNGQLVYPVPPGFQPPNVSALPISMLGNPNAAGPALGQPPQMMFPQQMQLSGLMGHSQYPMVTGNGHPQLMAMPGIPSMMFPSFPQPFGLPLGPMPMQQQVPVMMPHNMLPLRNNIHDQIGVLEQQVKFLENQLQTNKNHIDQGIMMQQHNLAQMHLHALQTSPATRSVGRNAFSPDNNDMQMASAEKKSGLADHSRQTTPEYTVHSAHKTNVLSPAESVKDSEPVLSKPRAGSKAIPIMSSPSHAVPRSDPGMNIRSRLSAAAAMAPEFQPRPKDARTSEKENERASEGFQNLFSEQKLLSESQPAILGMYTGGTNFPTPHPPGPMHVPMQLPQVAKPHTVYGISHTTPFSASTQYPNAHVTSAFQRIGQQVNEKVPYLMGFPPPGTSFAGAEPRELVYSRPLTADEVQARHLYWGKAPRDVARGLPQFDGRDFYPPSPTKPSPVKAMVTIPGLQLQSSAMHVDSARSDSSCQSSIAPKKLLKGHSAQQCRLSSNGESATSFVTSEQDKEGYEDDNAKVDDTASVDSWDMPKHQVFLEKDFDHNTDASRHSTSRSVTVRSSSSNSVHLDLGQSRPSSIKAQTSSFLANMLKNTPHRSVVCGSAVTGASSSTTAHGYLPNVRESTPPTMAPLKNESQVSTRSSPRYGPRNDANQTFLPSPATKARSENRPPSQRTTPSRSNPSATDLLRKLRGDHGRQTTPESAKYTGSQQL